MDVNWTYSAGSEVQQREYFGFTPSMKVVPLFDAVNASHLTLHAPVSLNRVQ